MNAFPTQADPRAGVRPSPAFLVVVVALALGAWLCVNGGVPDGVAVFVFVAAAWILSLIFHEFAHAFLAWKGGDTSIPAKGYLTLDPRRYTDPLTSILLPLIFVVIGGIGLPGGAVWINRGALRSQGVASLVSLGGPATNLVFAALCLVPLSIGMIDPATQPVLAPAMAFTGFLQIVAFVLNMLPIPGLDGFGALEPFLPHSVLVSLAPIRRWGFLILIVALFYVEPVGDWFWGAIETVMDVFGVDRALAGQGWNLFRFWV